MFRQPTTFDVSALRVTKCYVLRQWVAYHDNTLRVTRYDSELHVTTACEVLRQLVSFYDSAQHLRQAVTCYIHVLFIKIHFSCMLLERVCSTNPILDHVKQIFSLHEELQLN